jgi:hypothetical protein
MNHSTDRDEFERQAIARLDIDVVIAGNHRSTYAQSVGCENVAALAIGITEERNPRGTIRIVLDRFHLRRNIELVTFKID